MTLEHLIKERQLPDTLPEWVRLPVTIKFAGPDGIQKEVVQIGWEADIHYFGGAAYRETVKPLLKRKHFTEEDGLTRIKKVADLLYPKLTEEQRKLLVEEARCKRALLRGRRIG